ncbi:MAG: hypothetical protein J7L75_02195 [Thermoproteales archaeon]|nr:hypothetical protein [Thermoproteales archaeon]
MIEASHNLPKPEKDSTTPQLPYDYEAGTRVGGGLPAAWGFRRPWLARALKNGVGFT